MENYIISTNPIVQIQQQSSTTTSPSMCRCNVGCFPWMSGQQNMEMIIIYNGWIAITGCFRDHQLIYINL